MKNKMKSLLLKFNNLTENDKIVLKNMLGAFAVKGLSLVISLFTMPSYMRFFHNETVLGLWFTVLSILNWLLNFDLGVGNGLRNHLSRSLTEKTDAEAKKYISSAYVSIGILCVITTGIFYVVFDYINWNTVFNIDTQILSPNSLLVAVKIVFTGIMVQLFLKLISSILYAMQKSSINNFMTLCTSVITILLIQIIPSRSNEENIISMAFVHAFAVALPLSIATLFVFFKTCLRTMRPSIRFLSKSHTKDVLSLGGMFFFVQIAYMIIMNTNDYMITWLLGSEYVVEYQIYNRLFTLGSMVFTLAMTPIWSAVTKAAAENNRIWIQALYRKMIRLACIGILAEFLIIPLLQILVNFWLGEEAIKTSVTYGLVFAALGGMMILSGTFSSITNGLGKLKIQAVCFCVGSLLKYPLAVVVVSFTGSWISVPIANAAVLAIYCIVEQNHLKRYFTQAD